MTSEFEAQLRAASLHMTRPRLAVLTGLSDHSHVDTDTVISLVRFEHPMVSHQAVSDVPRADVDGAVGHACCLTASDDHGFVVDEADVDFWGIRSDCATKPISK